MAKKSKADFAQAFNSGEPADRLFCYWLLFLAGAIMIMIMIGAITRLTDSGLSMVEWRPLMGVLPPLGADEWQRIFSLYKGSPEYLLINEGMLLAEFKAIFFWEYLHRLWGRLLGIFFIVPLLYFAYRRKLPQGFALYACLLFILGALQGVIGWWMVKSGLINRPDVSHFRLALHLGLAILLYGAFIWLFLHYYFALPKGQGSKFSYLNMVAIILCVLVFITIIAGAFVAGLKAGLIYNEWPLMGEKLIPPDYLASAGGFWYSFFNNPTALQFNHRILAYIIVFSGVILWFRQDIVETATPRVIRKAARFLLLAILIQLILGITTLINGVPIILATLHQSGAIMLFTAALVFSFFVNRLS